MNDNDVVIVSAARTPIGKFQGTFQAVTAPNWARLCCAGARRRRSWRRTKC
ncbi:MAG: hypothetical protein R2856_20405 [Caldilineaceae bacterium]